MVFRVLLIRAVLLIKAVNALAFTAFYYIFPRPIILKKRGLQK